MQIILHPGFAELKKEYLQLKNEMLNLITERDLLVTTIGPNIEAIYLKEAGHLKLQYLQYEVEYLRIKRKIELIQASLNANDPVDESSIDGLLTEEFEQWEKEINRLSEEVDNAKKLIASQLSDDESAELKLKYREIAKKLHPDLNPNIDDKGKELWLSAAEAYENGDLNEIKRIFLLLDEIPDRNQEGAHFDFTEKIVELKEMIRQLKNEINTIKNSYPHNYGEIIKDPDRLREMKENIQSDIDTLKNKTKELKLHLSNLLIVVNNEHHN